MTPLVPVGVTEAVLLPVALPGAVAVAVAPAERLSTVIVAVACQVLLPMYVNDRLDPLTVYVGSGVGEDLLGGLLGLPLEFAEIVSASEVADAVAPHPDELVAEADTELVNCIVRDPPQVGVFDGGQFTTVALKTQVTVPV